ncbi:hypothetical protein F7725_012006 [Dissostichus mawsoni]|uniref:Uncharacterized protein n=1 Tax=Dissostichus mawsoni TaxID=36200 RepID=A0A7J5ZAK3_DISMA|nr:hypothetical protein F7725_012006 [Dissostichus mawsoni]
MQLDQVVVRSRDLVCQSVSPALSHLAPPSQDEVETSLPPPPPPPPPPPTACLLLGPRHRIKASKESRLIL